MHGHFVFPEFLDFHKLGFSNSLNNTYSFFVQIEVFIVSCDNAPKWPVDILYLACLAQFQKNGTEI